MCFFSSDLSRNVRLHQEQWPSSGTDMACCDSSALLGTEVGGRRAYLVGVGGASERVPKDGCMLLNMWVTSGQSEPAVVGSLVMGEALLQYAESMWGGPMALAALAERAGERGTANACGWWMGWPTVVSMRGAEKPTPDQGSSLVM